MKPLMNIDERFEIELDQDDPLLNNRGKSEDTDVKSSKQMAPSLPRCEQQAPVAEKAMPFIVFVD